MSRHSRGKQPARKVDSLKQFNPTRVFFPALLGLGIVAYLLYRELIRHGLSPTELLARMAWTSHTFLWLLLGCMMVVLREVGYIWQLHILTDGKVKWRNGFQIVMLWNFFAAVSPSMLGGTAVAAFMLNKEKLSLGHSTAIVFTTVFLDEVFFVSIPLLASLIIPQDDIFAPLKLIPSELLGTSVYGAFWSAWGSIAAYVVFLGGALFIAPNWVHWWLTKLLLLPFMHRWRVRGFHLVSELTTASRDLRDRSTVWWLRVWAATSLAWIGRYLVLNCVLAAFLPANLNLFDHFLVAGRQAVLWILMIVSPTPGSAGVAELGFSWLFRDMIPNGLALGVAVIWRLISYYPYLILGIFVMTHWIKRVYGSDVRHDMTGAVR